MARRNNPDRSAARPLSSGTLQRTEDHADGAWVVSTWTARPGGRNYRCPVCGGDLPAASAHLVVWPADRSAADRRHVHPACWRRRSAQRQPVRW
jgi:hypothetical protein